MNRIQGSVGANVRSHDVFNAAKCWRIYTNVGTEEPYAILVLNEPGRERPKLRQIIIVRRTGITKNDWGKPHDCWFFSFLGGRGHPSAICAIRKDKASAIKTLKPEVLP